MIRLHITAEGQTEQRFAKMVLAPHLCPYQVFVDARCVLTSRNKRQGKEYRGGLVSYARAKEDIQRWLKEDKQPECRFTTMFDLYALPQDFPGFDEAQKQSDAYRKIAILEARLKEDIEDKRFLPYIQLHEFETLILADPQQLDWEYLEYDAAIAGLVAMVGNENPELINNSPETAPSKRILNAIPEYDKATAGPAVAGQIGIQKLREKCRHFHEWLTTLEQLNGRAHE